MERTFNLEGKFRKPDSERRLDLSSTPFA